MGRWWLWWLGVACTGSATRPEDTNPVDSDTDGVADSDSDAETDAPGPTTERIVVYQLVVRHFSNVVPTRKVDGTLAENGSGRFVDIDAAALSGIRELGATHVWLTGLPRQATTTDWSPVGVPPDDPDVVKGRAGSFFAVKDWYDTSPDYAQNPEQRLEELDALIANIQAADLKVVMDFVPNHVARGYTSTTYPERDFGIGDDTGLFWARDNHFFYLVEPPGQALRLRRPAGWNPTGLAFDGAFAQEDGAPGRPPKTTGNDLTRPDPGADDWYDVVKLNWGRNFVDGKGVYEPRPRTWEAMDEVLAFWQARGIDGFRVDFAHWVPPEAWRWLLGRARERNPDVWFVAEAYADLDGLLASGFDAVYNDAAYDTLKGLYTGDRSQADVDRAYLALTNENRHQWLHYLENHDERRLASPIVTGRGPDASGFGAANAVKQLGPIHLLASSGPALLYNGQEVGETGAGAEGYGGDDGRTTLFDYWSLPALQGWVHNHRYDGGGLTAEQRALRAWYVDFGRLLRDPAVAGSGFWGLEYLNNSSANPGFPDDLYSFARFAPGAGRLLIVVANFRPGSSVSGSVRVPEDALTAAGVFGSEVQVRRLFDEGGAQDGPAERLTRDKLVNEGLTASVADQAAVVFEVTAR
jgi:glycosidase